MLSKPINEVALILFFWTHHAFGPVQYYPMSASSFVRVGAGCHIAFLNIKPTLEGHRFVTFEKKSKGVSQALKAIP